MAMLGSRWLAGVFKLLLLLGCSKNLISLFQRFPGAFPECPSHYGERSLKRT